MVDTYDGLLLFVAVGLLDNEDCWLSHKNADDVCWDALGCWKLPPHTGVDVDEGPDVTSWDCCCRASFYNESITKAR